MCAAARRLLVYARYDLTFPVDLSRMLVRRVPRRGIPHEVAILPCGHYSTGVAPFKWMDGIALCRFLSRTRSRWRLQVFHDALERVVEHAGERLDERRHFTLRDGIRATVTGRR